jgi:hypothetical protein
MSEVKDANKIYQAPDVQDYSQHVIMPCEKNGEYFIKPVIVSKKPVYDFVKRFFDVLSSGIGMLV